MYMIKSDPSWENKFMLYANKKGTGQSVHVHSLISAHITFLTKKYKNF